MLNRVGRSPYSCPQRDRLDSYGRYVSHWYEINGVPEEHQQSEDGGVRVIHHPGASVKNRSSMFQVGDKGLFKIIVLFAALCSVGYAQASDSISMEKTKTGILPSGEFYVIYEATCDDKTGAHLASMGRGTRWCVQNHGQLNCFRQPGEALRAACQSGYFA